MKADEAAEMMDAEKTRDTFKQRAAVTIAIFAMILAITGLGGSNAGKEAVNNNVLASNYWTFFQAKNMRQTSYALAADQLELRLAGDPALSPEAQAEVKKKIEAYRKTVARYESEPETREGKKELIQRAKEYEDPYFDYAEALLQIAIVLISVAIVADIVWLSFVGGALGILGALLTLNGFYLFVQLPFLS
jgi:hypothetical protein